MESILTSIKKMLGLTDGYEYFDTDIIIHINTALSALTQMGIGPSEGFSIADENATWSDFIEDRTKYLSVKTYVYAKVKLIFDPPTTGSHVEALKEAIRECEWRLNVAAESQ